MKKIQPKLYKKIQEVLPIACVDIVIVDPRKGFLMLKRKNDPAKGKWWFLGGRIKKGESLEKSALHKAKEETGKEVILKRILGEASTIFKKGVFGGSVHTVNIVFLAQFRNKGKIILDEQSSDYRWFRKMNAGWHPYLKYFLNKAGF